MSVPITVLGVTSLWPTTGDTGYSAQAEQLQKLLAQAVLPIEGLYNTNTGLVGNLGYSDLGELTLNGTPITGLENLTVTTNNGITNSLTNVGGAYSLTLGLGDITPSKVTITAATGSDALVLSNVTKIRSDFSTAFTSTGRTHFQTSVSNNRTNISAIPNGTTTGSSGFSGFATNDPANSNFFGLGSSTTGGYLQNSFNGTATQTPMYIYNGATSSDGITIDATNNVSIAQNLELSGAGKLLTADFSNATAANRVYVQTSTTNSNTRFGIKPNGTATTSGINVENNSTIGNNGLLSAFAGASTVGVGSYKRGTGTLLPFVIEMDNVTKFTMATNGDSTFTGTLAASNLSGTNTGDQTLNSLLPSQTGNAGKTLATDGANTYWSSAGSGTVTSVSVVTANGVSGTVATPTTTPAITLTLGDITPSSVSTAGNITFTGAGNGLRGDFSNATIANRNYFQTTTTNGATNINAAPNGTSTNSSVSVDNSSALTNDYRASLFISNTEAGIAGAVRGTGTALPFNIYNNAVNAISIDTAGQVTVNTNLAVTGAITTTDSVQFDTAATPTQAVGKLMWNSTDGTLEFGLVGGNVNLQIGQELVQYVLNKTGSNMVNGQIVRVTGAQGSRLTAGLAQANSKANCTGTLGMLTEDIANNQQGFVTTNGIVHDVNTGGYADGDILYLSASTPGGYTNVQPAVPNQTVIIGYVVRAHATVGQIYIDVQQSSDLTDLADVDVSGPTSGQVLAYNGTYWTNTATTAALTMPSITLSAASGSDALVFSNGGAIRIPGTIATNTPYVESNVTNGQTRLRFYPNGTNTNASVGVFNSSDKTNNAATNLVVTSTESAITSTTNGTGTALPLKFIVNNSTTALTIDTSGNATFTNAVTGFVSPNVQGPTSVTGTTTINWANKDVTKLTLTGNTAITNSGAVDGQKMILQLVQGGSGSYTVTFTSETKFGTSFTSITLSTAVGTMDMVGLVYSAVNSKYNIVSFAAGY